MMVINPTPKYGWVCPLCQVVHAPDVRECHCQNLASSLKVPQAPERPHMPFERDPGIKYLGEKYDQYSGR